MEKVNLQQKFALFSDHWQPKMIGELNDFAVKIVKVKGNLSGITMTGRMNSFLWSKGGF